MKFYIDYNSGFDMFFHLSAVKETQNAKCPYSIYEGIEKWACSGRMTHKMNAINVIGKNYVRCVGYAGIENM